MLDEKLIGTEESVAPLVNPSVPGFTQGGVLNSKLPVTTLNHIYSGKDAILRFPADSHSCNQESPQLARLLRLVPLVLCAGLLISTVGCLPRGEGGGVAELLGRKEAEKGLPHRHSVTADQLEVISDLRLGSRHPLVKELKVLRDQIHEKLELPLDDDSEKVTVYLFSNESQYRNYLTSVYPELPFRRAYFIGTPDKLAVYTFWGERIFEDLRHEYTHGLLHASLQTVPLWLDEGLAEYFEVPGDEPGTVNNEYSTRLARAVQSGWRPDIRRLERLEKVDQMHRADYRESWAWVHFMLHGSPDAKLVLLEYLQELEATDRPGKLSTELVASLPEVDARFLNYVASLNTFRRWLSTPPTEQIAAPKRRETVSRANAH